MSDVREVNCDVMRSSTRQSVHRGIFQMQVNISISKTNGGIRIRDRGAGGVQPAQDPHFRTGGPPQAELGGAPPLKENLHLFVSVPLNRAL